MDLFERFFMNADILLATNSSNAPFNDESLFGTFGGRRILFEGEELIGCLFE